MASKNRNLRNHDLLKCRWIVILRWTGLILTTIAQIAFLKTMSKMNNQLITPDKRDYCNHLTVIKTNVRRKINGSLILCITQMHPIWFKNIKLFVVTLWTKPIQKKFWLTTFRIKEALEQTFYHRRKSRNRNLAITTTQKNQTDVYLSRPAAVPQLNLCLGKRDQVKAFTASLSIQKAV